MSVQVTWDCDPAYGTGPFDFTGVVTNIDDWITVVDSFDVTLHMPLSHARDIVEA